MIVNMLEAISEMLAQDDKMVAQEYFVRARCAKVMLDKVIEAMRVGADVTPFISPLPPRVTLPAPKPKRTENEVQIIVEHGKISSIQNAKDNTKIELDGKVYGWQEAIGKSFSEGRVL